VLTTGGASLSRTVEVLKDPSTSGTAADIGAQTDLALKIRDDLDSVAARIDRLEWLRKQLADLASMLKDDEGEGGQASAGARLGQIRERVDAVADSAAAVEGRLFDIHLTGAREDAFRHPNRLWSRYGALLTDVAEESSDFAPTDQQVAVFGVLHQRLQEANAAYESLMSQSVPALRTMRPGRGRALRAPGRGRRRGRLRRDGVAVGSRPTPRWPLPLRPVAEVARQS